MLKTVVASLVMATCFLKTSFGQNRDVGSEVTFTNLDGSFVEYLPVWLPDSPQVSCLCHASHPSPYRADLDLIRESLHKVVHDNNLLGRSDILKLNTIAFAPGISRTKWLKEFLIY